MTTGVSNTGTLLADGGTILVTAQAAAGVLDNVINMQGVAEARSVAQQNGDIIISGDTSSGIVNVAGTLDASGKNSGETGGNVSITGYDILLNPQTVIDASGDVGGGNIYIGGNFHGAGPLPNANALVMLTGATINANALSNGNGGNVALWSNNDTQVFGSISAEGGSVSGNGGYIETSGSYLNVNGLSVNTSAINGSEGTWLLDPSNLTISTSANSGVNLTGSNPFITAYTANNNTTSTVTTTGTNGLEAQLANTNVNISTGSVTGGSAGTITVSSPITWSYTSALTLSAASNIAINAAITDTSGTLILNSTGGSISQSAAISVGTLTTSSVGGTVLNTSGNTISIFGATNTGSGNISLTNGATLSINGINQSGGGTTSITNTGALTVNSAISGGAGSVTLNSAGLLTVGANISTTNQPISLTGTSVTVNSLKTINAGTSNITLDATTASTGAITINSGDFLESGNSNGTAGTITLTSDMMTLAGQIGGTSNSPATGYAEYTIIQPTTATQAINIASSSVSNLTLTVGELTDIYSTNVRFGSTTSTGAISIGTSGTWSPAANFAFDGTITLSTGGNITQNAAINLTNDHAGLLLRNSVSGTGTVTLTNASNILSTIAASRTGSSGSLTIDNGSTHSLTVGTLDDDLSPWA